MTRFFINTLLLPALFLSLNPVLNAQEDAGQRPSLADDPQTVSTAEDDTSQTPPETLLLTLKPVPNKVYRVLSTSKYKTSHFYADNTILTQQEVVAEWVYRIQDYEESTGRTNLGVSLEALEVTQKTGETVLRYDSTAATGPESEQSPAAKGFSLLIGAQFEATVNAGGRVQEIRGAGNLVENRLEELGAPDTAVRQEVQTQLERFFGPAALQDVVQGLTALLPPVPENAVQPEPVAQGASWRIPAAVTGFITSGAELTATLENPDAGIETARLTIQGEVTPPAEPARFPVGDATVQMLVSGNVTGGANVNRQTGWVVKSAQRVSLQGTVKAVENSYDLAQPEWKVAIEGSIVHELVTQ